MRLPSNIVVLTSVDSVGAQLFGAPQMTCEESGAAVASGYGCGAALLGTGPMSWGQTVTSSGREDVSNTLPSAPNELILSLSPPGKCNRQEACRS